MPVHYYSQGEQDRDDESMRELADAVAARPRDYTELTDTELRSLAQRYDLAPLTVRQVIATAKQNKHVPPSITVSEPLTPQRFAHEIRRLPRAKRIGAWIGFELRRQRLVLQLKPIVVAAQLAVDARTLLAYERGTASVKVERLHPWCEALDLTMSMVIERAEERMREFPSDVP